MQTASVSSGTWPGIVSQLPSLIDLETSARETGALIRRRGVRSAADLLDLALLYGPGGMSLRSVTKIETVLTAGFEMSAIPTHDTQAAVSRNDNPPGPRARQSRNRSTPFLISRPPPQRTGLVRQPIQVQFLRQTPQNLAKLIRQDRC